MVDKIKSNKVKLGRVGESYKTLILYEGGDIKNSGLIKLNPLASKRKKLLSPMVRDAELIEIEIDAMIVVSKRGVKELKEYILRREKEEFKFWSEYGKKELIGGSFIYEIQKQGDIRNVIILSQLYLEYICDKIIEKRFRYPLYIQNSNLSFFQKLNILKSNGHIPDDIYRDVTLINQLRNKYAHNLFYDITNSHLTKFTYCHRVNDIKTNNNKEIQIHVYRHIIKELIWDLLHRLTKKFEFIGKLKKDDEDRVYL